MRRTAWWLLAALSMMPAARGIAAIRPRYGGTLRVEMRERVLSVDPADRTADPLDAAAAARLQLLVFERLVRFDAGGRAQPALAVAWQSDPERRRWEFRLRPGVRFHDGYPLTTVAVGGVLQRLLGARATVSVSDQGLVVQGDRPLPGLLAELARPAAAVAARGPEGELVGTGPFRVSRFEAGRRLSLAAYEDYWGGRPFAGAVEVEMGRALRDQLVDLQLGRADLVEIAPNEARAAGERGRRMWSSAPAELMALVFGRGGAAEDARLREALALSIDRAAIHNVLLQRQGEIAGGLLPEWLSGYAFLFPAGADLARARSLVSAVAPNARTLVLACDGTDALERIIAERIAVNARDAGITLQVSGTRGGRADVRLVRACSGSLDAGQALLDLAAALGLEVRQVGNLTRPEMLYAAERALLEDHRAIPLFHLPLIYGVGAKLRTWLEPGVGKAGALRLAGVWLESDKP